MMKRVLLVLAVLLACMNADLTKEIPQNFDINDFSYIKAFNAVKDSVVAITITEYRYGGLNPLMPFQQSIAQRGSSGFIVSEDGDILTTWKIVETGKKFEVRLSDGSTYEAEIKGHDWYYDIALLKIVNAGGRKFKPVKFNFNVEVGEPILAIGNPLNLGLTATHGIVSAIRDYLNLSFIYVPNMIQTDASLNEGNEGGVVVNSKGEVVGMVSIRLYYLGKLLQPGPGGSVKGLSFCLPAKVVAETYKKLKEGKTPFHPWFGLRVEKVSQNVAMYVGIPYEYLEKYGTLGVIVSSNGVDYKGPAAKAGIVPTDVIIKVVRVEKLRKGEETEEDELVLSPRDFYQKLARVEEGEKVQLVVIREGNPIHITITPKNRPEDAKIGYF